MEPGDTFFLSSSPDDGSHLWIILSRPNADNEVIIAYLTSRRAHSDLTVVLKEGDHRFVRRETAVAFADARIVRLRRIEARVGDGTCPTHDRLSSEILSRIQDGLIQSDLTPKKIKSAFGALHSGYEDSVEESPSSNIPD